MFSDYSKFPILVIYSFLIVTALARLLCTLAKNYCISAQRNDAFQRLAMLFENIFWGLHLNSVFLNRSLSRRILQWIFLIILCFVYIDFVIMSILVRLISKYSPAIMLPISAVVGFIGYKVENWISDKYTPSLKSVKEKREERLLNEEKEVESLKEHQFVPKTIFEKNLSPSLKEPDPRLKKYSEMRS